MENNLHHVEVNYKNLNDCEIKVDEKPVNGISALSIDLEAGRYPHVVFTPAVSEIQFGNQASVDVYVELLEEGTCEMLLKAIKNRLKEIKESS